MATIFMGDWGTTFRITVQENGAAMDVSAATAKQILLKPPTGILLTKTAVFTTDGTNGQIEYVSIDGDLNEAGAWQIQGLVTFANGKWHTTIGAFTVTDALD